jgi:hypothetical protein
MLSARTFDGTFGLKYLLLTVDGGTFNWTLSNCLGLLGSADE